jgi:hypothetical protein
MVSCHVLLSRKLDGYPTVPALTQTSSLASRSDPTLDTSHMTGTPPILIDAQRSPKGLMSDSHRAWRWIGWLSLVLALAGLGDWVIAWIPMRFGSAEWEFGTIVASFSGLPLVTMGFAGLLASAIARGVRWQILAIALVILLFALLIAIASVVFLLDVPVALQAVGGGVARLGILKAIAKTGLLGALFFFTYLVAGVAALRHTSSRPNRAK